jgi:hypothetical protein
MSPFLTMPERTCLTAVNVMFRAIRRQIQQSHFNLKIATNIRAIPQQHYWECLVASFQARNFRTAEHILWRPDARFSPQVLNKTFFDLYFADQLHPVTIDLLVESGLAHTNLLCQSDTLELFRESFEAFDGADPCFSKTKEYRHWFEHVLIEVLYSQEVFDTLLPWIQRLLRKDRHTKLRDVLYEVLDKATCHESRGATRFHFEWVSDELINTVVQAEAKYDIEVT